MATFKYKEGENINTKIPYSLFHVTVWSFTETTFSLSQSERTGDAKYFSLKTWKFEVLSVGEKRSYEKEWKEDICKWVHLWAQTCMT